MQVVSLTEARNNLKSVFDSVYIDHEDVVIHRKGRDNIVMISMDEYNSMKETLNVLSSKHNRDRLLDAVQEIENSKFMTKDIDV